MKLSCWHGLLPDDDTTDMLKEDGDFLVRGVQSIRCSVFVSIKWGLQVSVILKLLFFDTFVHIYFFQIMNIAIVRQEDGQYRFTEGGDTFDSPKELVDYFQVSLKLF